MPGGAETGGDPTSGSGEGAAGHAAGRPGRRLMGDLGALLLIIPLAVSVLAPGFFGGHDDLQPARLFQHHVMVTAGHFPVRWYPDVAAGYGSPEPLFYGQFFFLLGELFLLLGLSLPAALKASILVALAGASWSTYRLVREFFGDGAGLVAAAAITYSPYHLADLFVRAAFSELTVFVFVPLALLAFHRLGRRQSPGAIAAAAAAFGGLLISHTISIMLGPIVIGAWLLVLGWRERFRKEFVGAAAAAALIGLGIAAYFIAPVVAERGAIDMEFYASGYYSYQDHFVAPWQLLYSPWGFGVSVPGDQDGMSFRLGALQILGSLIAIFAWRRIRDAAPGSGTLAFFGAGLAAAGIFMSLPVSAPIWSAFPPFRFLGLPLRLLLGPAVGMAILAGAVFGSLPWLRRWRWWAAAVACAAFIAAGAPIIGFQDRAPLEEFRYRTEENGTPWQGKAQPTGGRLVFTREFIREQFIHWSDRMPIGWWPYPTDADIARQRAEIVRGDADLSITEAGPVRYRMTVQARTPALVRINVYRFPGWQVRIDGRTVPWGPLPFRRPVVTVEVPEGPHEVEVTLARTPARWLGDLTSLTSLLLVTGLAAAQAASRR